MFFCKDNTFFVRATKNKYFCARSYSFLISPCQKLTFAVNETAHLLSNTMTYDVFVLGMNIIGFASIF